MQRIFETPPRRRAIASSSDSNIYLAKDPFMSGAALKSSSLPLLLQQNAATMTGINLWLKRSAATCCQMSWWPCDDLEWLRFTFNHHHIHDTHVTHLPTAEDATLLHSIGLWHGNWSHDKQKQDLKLLQFLWCVAEQVVRKDHHPLQLDRKNFKENFNWQPTDSSSAGDLVATLLAFEESNLSRKTFWSSILVNGHEIWILTTSGYNLYLHLLGDGREEIAVLDYANFNLGQFCHCRTELCYLDLPGRWREGCSILAVCALRWGVPEECT